MRIQDIIRSMIDMIDGVEQEQEQEPEQTTTIIVSHPTATIDEPADASPLTHGDDIRRFKQIVDLADNDGVEPYGNTPKEKYADIDSVTCDAGGGMQAPKHPADIRGEHPSMYPAYQAGFGE